MLEARTVTEASSRRFFYALCAVGALAILSTTMSKNPVLPLFAKSLGAEGEMLGFIASASTIPGILVSLPAGSLSDLLGRRKVILISGGVFATAPLLYLFVQSPWQLIAVRFYHGFATAIFGPVANAAIVERYPERKAERVSTFSSFTVVGRSTAPFLGGFILFATGSNFRSLYAVVAGAGVSALLVMAVLPLEKAPSKTSAQQRPTRVSMGRQVMALSENRGVLVTSVVEAVQYLTYGSLEFFIVAYAQGVGVGVLELGLLTGAQLVTVVFAKPLMGRLSDRYGRVKVIMVGLLTGGLPLMLIPFTTSFIVLALISVLYGLGFALVTSSTPALVSDLAGKESSGAAMGFLSTIMDIGQTAGPIITGFILTTALGYLGVFWFLGLSLLLITPAFWALLRSLPRTE